MTSLHSAKIKVLSIDSGGVNGVVSLKILCELEKQLGKPISEVFDYFIGSSAGGIIVSLLNLKDENGRPIYTAKEVFNHSSSSEGKCQTNFFTSLNQSKQLQICQ